MKSIFFLTLIFTTAIVRGQIQNLPQWFSEAYKSRLDKKYEIRSLLKPAFIQADFNGDGEQDVAVWVAEKASNRKGILVIHGKTNDYFIFGAGIKFGNGSDDFKWADKWALYTKKTASETQFDKTSGDIIGGKQVSLARPGIIIEDYEDGAAISGGIIYWNGKKYIWIHLGE